MLNEVTIIGRLGADPEIRYTQGGSKVASYNVATTEKWKDKNSGRVQEKTEWHRISAWGFLADNAEQYMHKGDLVLVKGSLETQKWDDKQGVTHYTTQIKAKMTRTLQSKGGNQNSDSGYSSYNPSDMPSMGDDVPF